MTTIEKIKQARQEFVTAMVDLKHHLEPEHVLPFEVCMDKFGAFAYAQAEALRQATEVADENFERAQKLSEQVQDNVRHIERLAERRSNADQQIVEAVEAVAYRIETFVEAERAMPFDSLQVCQDKLTIALALAKGEAV